MNQTLRIAANIYGNIILARPGGNRVTQANEALSAAAILIEEAQRVGIDTSDNMPPVVQAHTTAPETVKVSPSPYEPRPLSFGAKRKS